MRPGGPGIFSCLSPLSTALDKREQDPGGTARLRKLYGTKSSVGGGASGAHPAYTWKRGQIWGCAQIGVRQCAGPCLGTVTAQLGGQHKVSCSSLVELQ